MNLNLSLKDIETAAEATRKAIDNLKGSLWAIVAVQWTDDNDWVLTDPFGGYPSWRFVLGPHKG